MRKLKVTEGKAIVVLGTKDSFAKVKIGNRTLDLRTMELPSTQYKSENANAQLIADAFNTANKCDMLPSELLGQRDEAINLLKRIVIAVEQKHADKFGFGKTILGADTFLKKVFYNE